MVDSAVQKIPEVFNEGGGRTKKNGGITGILHTAIQENVLLQTSGTSRKCRPTLQKCAFWRSSLPDFKNSQMGNPKFFLDLGFRKFISFTLSDIEKFAEFNSEIIFRIRLKVMQWCKADPWIGL